MSTENSTEQLQNLNIQAETREFLHILKNLDMNTLIFDYIIPYGTKILLAFVIYFIGKMFARWLSKVMGRIAFRSTRDEMLQGFVVSISYFLFLLMTIIAALSQLGINTASLVALIGAAGLAVGLALQNSLQNFAAGVMILIFKPFGKGDYIEAGGTAGTVRQMGLLTLELRTGDNKSVLVPNGKILADKITNYSKNMTRRIDLIFDIAYEADIAEAKAIIAQCLKQDERILTTPEPLIAVGALATSSVQLFVRPWVKTGDYWGVYYNITEQVKLEFDKANIAIPYDQVDIHFPDEITVNKKSA
ncbi:small conductance mechanosensitive channel [Volucribacter psittacicida]|uniref:Small-conductance mechanosensitive channel n=1 Tax=Volucribacter psittacicida TaxID=203482 RepID=A0A4R1FVG3_9PAST|nr:mechanosensitive ion channel domain-containing protein [Volucribacter psittacicida]TCJ98947.1 small conductance mechanosensitive channel [Volucribacter psittacicida]